MKLVEKMARAIAINHGADPDQIGPAGRHVVEIDGVTTIITDHMGPLWKMWTTDALAALEAFRHFDPGFYQRADILHFERFEAELNQVVDQAILEARICT